MTQDSPRTIDLPQPHLEDGTTYRPLRPTKLDKTENLHDEVQAGPVAVTLKERLDTPS